MIEKPATGTSWMDKLVKWAIYAKPNYPPMHEKLQICMNLY